MRRGPGQHNERRRYHGAAQPRYASQKSDQQEADSPPPPATVEEGRQVPRRSHTSAAGSSGVAVALTHGWVPLIVQLITAVVLLAAIGWRTRRWRLLWLPVALVAGVTLSGAFAWYIADRGLADDPAPAAMWVWITVTGLAGVVMLAGWRDGSWWRRGASALAVPLSLLCAALMLNSWVGYFPTVASAWDGMTGAPLPGQTGAATASAPNWKTIVSVTTPDNVSGFKHRQELVLLPPAWYASKPPPALPVVMMIGGEFGQPGAWIYAGNAQRTFDQFAAAHGGSAPVIVFPDYSGSFSNDTECVNGVRGNAADHLLKEVMPYVVANFGVSPNAANWGIVGWSSGGTCALMLSVMHPELFGAFVDMDGELGPNAGTKPQTIARLFGGDAKAWAAFDPRTVIANHGTYPGMSGWFAVSADTATVYHAPNDTAPLPTGDPSPSPSSANHAAVANSLCRLASIHGIECAVVPDPGKHDFSFAASSFAVALPWLAGKLGTPGVPAIAMPGAPHQ
ncbi:MAG: esterase family protein [Mycobacteriaceae bacterium]|nr:esterase family protein [Mycobacteriaceae bacterium]